MAPHLATEILVLAQQRALSYNALFQVLSIDPGLTAQVLRVANSPRFARERQVLDLKTAVNLIGFTTVKNLVLLTSRSSTVPAHRVERFYSQFWHHSTLSAYCSRELALMAGFDLADQAFVGGLLHNLGQLALSRSQPLYSALADESSARGEPISRLEMESLGTTHHEVGSRLFQEWSFPEVYADVAREHGQVNITSEHKQTILLVSLGSFIASNAGPRRRRHPLSLMDHTLPFLGLSRSTLEAFQDRCLEGRARDPLFGMEGRSLLP